MRVVYAPGCDADWWANLTSWQREDLASVHRQGKHLADRTNHGSDERWLQAGCKTRDSYRVWRRTSRGDRRAHERVVIVPTDYGYEKVGIRRETTFNINAETGVLVPNPEGWVIAWCWYVSRNQTANFPPNREEVCA